MQDRIRNAAVSGEGPDITQAGTTQVPFFAALQGFEDLAGRVEDIGGEAAYPEGVWQTTQMAGQDGIWAVPWFTEARAIYYRKDVLEKAGVAEDGAFADWDAMTATLQAIKDKVPEIDGKPIQPFGSPGKKAYDLVHHVMPFVWDAGGAELSDDNTKSTINSPEAAQGVSYFADLLQKGLYDKSQLQRDGTQVENQFKGGRIAVWIGGPWTYASTARTDDENWVPSARKNVGIAPMPTAPGGSEGYTFVGGSNLMMFKSAKNKDAAWEVMKFMSSDDFQTKYAELLGMFPSRNEPAAGDRGQGPGLPVLVRRDPAGPHVRADRAVGADRERLQGALREHPRRGRRRSAGLVQRRDRDRRARGRRRGSGRAARAERGRLSRPAAVSHPVPHHAAAGRAGRGASSGARPRRGPPAAARTRSPTR